VVENISDSDCLLPQEEEETQIDDVVQARVWEQNGERASELRRQS
jgi:hypothetical protein